MNHKKSRQFIYHGPTNIVGIPGYLSSWQKKNGFSSEFIAYGDGSTRQNHDINLNVSSYSRLRSLCVRFCFFVFALARYDVFHFYYGLSLLPLNLDLPFLRLFRKRIIMSYCGSEVRLIYVEARRNPFHKLLRIGIDDPKYDSVKKIKMGWHSIWVHAATAPRNLYDHVAEAYPHSKIIRNVWLNNVYAEVMPYVELESISTRRVPLVVHAPSDLSLKGTSYVRKAIETMRLKGLKFDYREINGVSSSDAHEIYRTADIIIDQMLLGGLGTLAFEVMSYGKPLVSYVTDQTVERDVPGCPVWNSNIDNLADRLEILISDPSLRTRLGREGVLYVRQNLDFDKIQRAVVELYKGR